MSNNTSFIETVIDKVTKNIGQNTVVKMENETGVILGEIKSVEEGVAFYVDEKRINIEEMEYILIENESIKKSKFS